MVDKEGESLFQRRSRTVRVDVECLASGHKVQDFYARRRASRWSFGDEGSLRQARYDSNLTITRRGPRGCVAILPGHICFVCVLVAVVSDAVNSGAG